MSLNLNRFLSPFESYLYDSHPDMSFQFNSKKFFLTYSQCGDLTREQVLLHMEYIHSAIKHYYIALEQHQDGNNHIHAFLEFSTPLRTRNCHIFDIGQYHPNIESAIRSQSAVIEYCQKEDEHPLCNFDVSEGIGKPKWKDTINMSTNYEDFLHNCEERHPRESVLSLERIQYFGRHKFGYNINEEILGIQRELFQETREMTQWVNDNISEVVSPASGTFLHHTTCPDGHPNCEFT